MISCLDKYSYSYQSRCSYVALGDCCGQIKNETRRPMSPLPLCSVQVLYSCTVYCVRSTAVYLLHYYLHSYAVCALGHGGILTRVDKTVIAIPLPVLGPATAGEGYRRTRLPYDRVVITSVKLSSLARHHLGVCVSNKYQHSEYTD